MRNTLAILFAALIMLSGMHPVVSTHFCCGEIAAVKWSFSGENASCGMPHSDYSSAETIVKALCCENEKAVFSTDENYAPSGLHHNFIPEITSVILLPASTLIAAVSATSSYFYTGSPPGDTDAGRTSLSGLCTFRI